MVENYILRKKGYILSKVNSWEMAIYKDQVFSVLIKICVRVHSSVVSDKVQGLSLQRAGTQGPSDPANHYSENSDRYLKQTQLCFGPDPRTGRKDHKQGV